MNKHICSLPDSDESLNVSTAKNVGQKIKAYVQECFLVSQKNPRTILNFRSYTEILMERKRQLTGKNRIIHPFSIFRVYYELVMMFVFLAHLITTPWDMYYDVIYKEPLTSGVQIYNSISFILSFTDICISFFTGYQDRDTKEVIIDRKKIRKQYATSWFFLFDVIATIPTELILPKIPNVETDKIRWVHMLCLTRLFRIPTTIIYMNNAADLWQISTLLYRTFRYVIFSVLILHWTGCISVIVSKYCHLYSPLTTQENWIRQAQIMPRTGKWSSYVTVLFRTAGCILGVKHGLYPCLTVEDKLMTTLIFIMGYFLTGFLLILTLQMIMSSAVPQLMNLAFLNQLDIYMNRIKLPMKAQKKLVSYYKFQFRENSFYDSESLRLLSDHLRHEITMFTYRAMVQNVTIIAEFPQESVDLIIKFLQREVYMPGDYVMKSGTTGTTMFFIIHGTVAISTYCGIEVCHLHDGAYFGEISLMLEEKRQANAIALEVCEVCRLERKHFHMCVDVNSDSYQKLLQRAVDRKNHLHVLNELYMSKIMKRSILKKRMSTPNASDDVKFKK